ncbi:SCO6745 family protein [Actinosynnema sp.]|uniref:SCO6745 family protein n=1 Tax=Actinosynnema sp. TaxID=1872144 RepID=UPI003F853AAC
MSDSGAARRLWLRYEPYHAVTYFTPESKAAARELGCARHWTGYFGMRAAPLGAALPEVVAASFYSFHPDVVARFVPTAWDDAAPADFLAARLRGVDGALRRLLDPAPTDLDGGRAALDLGDPATSAHLAEAADLAWAAAEAAPVAGRPLAAANRALGRPDEAHLALWQATAVLRESRGDGHGAALVAADLDPCEALVLFAAHRALDPARLRLARGWSPQEWADAEDRLAERGLLEHEPAEAEPVTGYARPAAEPAGREHPAPGGSAPKPPGDRAEATGSPTTPAPERRVVLTTAGIALREQVERVTDAVAERPWRVLGVAGTTRLSDLLTPLALTIGARNEVMRDNPMAIDPVRDLTD